MKKVLLFAILISAVLLVGCGQAEPEGRPGDKVTTNTTATPTTETTANPAPVPSTTPAAPAPATTAPVTPAPGK